MSTMAAEVEVVTAANIETDKITTKKFAVTVQSLIPDMTAVAP
ncbi:hypothetical protein A2U01_0046704, partial [Trifolium medium]|nr:hypothetical protein [Trifolium medium]